MITKRNAVVNSAAGYPKHRNAMNTPLTTMRCTEGGTQEFRWLIQPGCGDGGGIQPRGGYSDGGV